MGGDEYHGRKDEQARWTLQHVFSLDEWRVLGHDRHSAIADPGCGDPAAGDFTFGAGSPAAAFGIHPVDPAAAGPRPRARRD